MNIQEFCNKLENAEARSESVIAIFCDIRGFSNFSRDVESSDTSNFLKHFYLKLLREYFQDAVFAKPTGDGLLIIFRHDEKNLHEVSQHILSKCFQALKNFKNMFKNIPIINFQTPANIGFGIARGSASYLVVGDQILDYSGKLLNLAARLNELARPQGVVIDGHYQLDVIPKKSRKHFQKQSVYLWGIAEEEPIEVFYSQETSIPSRALYPLKQHKWELAKNEILVAEILQMNGDYTVMISEPLSRDKIRPEFFWPDNKVQNNFRWRPCASHRYGVDAEGHSVMFSLDEAKTLIQENALSPDSKFCFRVHYVPKPPPQKKKKLLQSSKKA